LFNHTYRWLNDTISNRDPLDQHKKAMTIYPRTEYRIRKFIKVQKHKALRFVQSFLYRRGVSSQVILSLSEMGEVKVMNPTEGWTQIMGDPTIQEINTLLHKQNLELPIDIVGFMPYLDLIHLNEYGFSAVKYGPIQQWLGSLLIIMSTGEKLNLITNGALDAHGKNIEK